MQKRMFVILAVLVLGTVAMYASTDPMVGVAPKQDLTLNVPTVVGGTLLPAGDYKVTHRMEGDQHIMIFKAVTGKATAEAKCNLVPLDHKAKSTEQRYTENAKNERVLVEMQFRGDTSKHVLVQ